MKNLTAFLQKKEVREKLIIEMMSIPSIGLEYGEDSLRNKTTELLNEIMRVYKNSITRYKK